MARGSARVTVQPTHLILVLAIALLVFEPENLPQIGKSLGEAIRGLKEAVQEGEAARRPRDDGLPPVL